jgi:hypothetical protein
MIMDYTTLKVGDIVAVALHGSWDISNQGAYRVVKANKVKVVVARVSDGYKREFSVRKRSEMSSVGSYYNAYLETVEEQNARIAQRQQEVDKRSAWAAVERAAKDKDFAALQQAVEKLESMLDPVPF